MKKYQEDKLECIFCGKDFDLNEIFISYVNRKHEIVISECLPCSEQRKPNTKIEKNGGWAVLQRDLNEDYKILHPC